VDARNRLESYCYSAKDAVADSSRDVKASASSLTADDKRAVLDAVQEAMDWLEEEGTSADADALIDKLKEVSVTSQSVTQKDTAGSPPLRLRGMTYSIYDVICARIRQLNVAMLGAPAIICQTIPTLCALISR